jgi:hypothetical protein
MIRAPLGASGSDIYKFSLARTSAGRFANRMRVGTPVAAAQAESDGAYARFNGAVLTALRRTESGLTVYARNLNGVAVLRVASVQSGKAARDAETLFRPAERASCRCSTRRVPPTARIRRSPPRKAVSRPIRSRSSWRSAAMADLIGQAPDRRRRRSKPPTFRVPSRRS